MAGGARDTQDMIKYLLREQLATDLQLNMDISMALNKYLSRTDTTDAVYEKLLEILAASVNIDSSILNRGLKYATSQMPINPPSLVVCDKLERFFEGQKAKCKADLYGVMKNILQSLRNRRSGDFSAAAKSISAPSTPQSRPASNSSSNIQAALMLQPSSPPSISGYTTRPIRMIHDFTLIRTPPKWFPPGTLSSLIDSGLFGWHFRRTSTPSTHAFPSFLYLRESILLGDQASLATALNIVRVSQKTEDLQLCRDIESMLKRKSPALFQYKHYKEQQPLSLKPEEIHRVISCLVSPPDEDPVIRNYASGIFIKLFMDLHCSGDIDGTDGVLMVLFEMIDSPQVETRIHVFDLLFNMSLHANMLEDNLAVKITHGRDGQRLRISSSTMGIYELQSIIFQKLKDVLLWLYTAEEEDESVWSAAFKCLLYFIIKEGHVSMNLFRQIDLRIVASFLKHLRGLGDEAERQIIRLAMNHCYKIDRFDINAFLSAIDISTVVHLYMKTRSREVRNNMFYVIFEVIIDNLVRKKQIQQNSDQIGVIFELLRRFDAPQLLQNVFKFCKEKVFVENFVKFVFLDRLKNDPAMAEITPKLDRSFIITVLYDIMKMTQTHWQLEKEFEAGYIHTTTTNEYRETEFNTLKALIGSQLDSDRRQGEAWLFSLLKLENDRGKTCRQHAETLFSQFAYHTSVIARRSYITVSDRMITFAKTSLPENPSEEQYGHLFRLLNESLLRLVDAQERNEQNLMEMWDIIVNLVGVQALRQSEGPYAELPADTNYDMILQGHLAVMTYLLHRVDVRILHHIYTNLVGPTYRNAKAVVLLLITELCKNKHNLNAVQGLGFFKEQMFSKDSRIVLFASNFIVYHFHYEFPSKVGSILL
eukprot:TRINITY_DN4155_c0_g1_i1.p1 TRINITY_DN4155_c0_g1~~TRINITY_DN4155_c0_g1_i1.p1  ORF type:complete len:875 (+),score=130.88 TRINITY_DN4155_c0_g1_i1:53-2677(+)